MSWTLHHSQSEHYANLAEEAVREQDNTRAIELYQLAAEAEILALEALESTKTRTIGITTVSAASLLYKAQKFRDSERLAYQWLMTDLLPEECCSSVTGITTNHLVSKRISTEKSLMVNSIYFNSNNKFWLRKKMMF